MNDSATVGGIHVGIVTGSIALLLPDPLRIQQLLLDLVVKRARPRLLQPLQRIQTLYGGGWFVYVAIGWYT